MAADAACRLLDELVGGGDSSGGGGGVGPNNSTTDADAVKEARRNAYGNLSAALLPLRAWAAALAAATAAAEIDHTWHKGHYRRGLALEGLAAEAEDVERERPLLEAGMATFRAAQVGLDVVRFGPELFTVNCRHATGDSFF